MGSTASALDSKLTQWSQLDHPALLQRKVQQTRLPELWRHHITFCLRQGPRPGYNIVTIHTAGRMYRQKRHGTRPRLGLGLEFAHGRACPSLLTFLYTQPAVCITSAWLQTIENDLRPLNLGLATAQRRAQNRTAWQTLVETATSLTSSGWWWWLKPSVKHWWPSVNNT